MDLMDLIKGQFSSEVIGKLGSAIGESHEKTESALGASIPAILAGLMKLASTGAGADILHKTANPSNLPSMGDLGGLLTGDTSALLKKGLAMLTSLFGDGATGAIIASLSKFSGIGGESAKKLLGYLLPIILSTIASKAGGMNAQGLAGMLTSQHDNLTKSLPEGFSLPSIEGLAPTAATSAGGMGAKLPMMLVLLAALAGLAYYLWPAPAEKGDTVSDQPQSYAPHLRQTESFKDLPPAKEAAKAVDAVAIGKDYTALFTSLTEAFSSVKDAATADSALTKLKESGIKLDSLKAMFDKIPADAKAKVVEVIKSGVEKLKELTTKVLALPGVSEKLKPIVDELMKKLGGLTS